MNLHKLFAPLACSAFFALSIQAQSLDPSQSALYASAEKVLFAQDDHPTATASVAGYTTGIGLRGGFTSGLSLKHFISSNTALEGIIGSRYYGFSFTGLYEIHKGNALGVSNLTWQYGFGGRVGYYPGRYYYRGGRCNNPNDRGCPGYWGDRYLTAIAVVGILGLEYRFDEIPFTVSLDLMPHFYITHLNGNFLDASISLRYILK